MLRGRQEEHVGRPDAVHRGHKGHGDAAADLVDVRQVLHHLNQPQHGADNPDRRSVSAGLLEDLRLSVAARSRAPSISSSMILRIC